MTKTRLMQIGLAAGTAIAYFLAARLGLNLLTQAEDVAVFWPASGIAAGLLIVLGPAQNRAVVAGVILGTIVANLMGDRNLWGSVFFALCNAGEALLVAVLVERWCGGYRAMLDSPRRVLAFLAAAGTATGISAIGGAIAINLFQANAPLLDTWRVWALSDGLGIIATAPVVIGIAVAVRRPPPRAELIEGVLALTGLAGVAAFIFSLPPQSWMAFEPIAVLFPLLLWIAARTPPVFAAAAVFIVSVGLVLTTTYGIGSFGDPATPLLERVFAAQAGIVVTTLCALVPAALFAERRQGETVLDRTNKRLQLALDGAELGVWDIDAGTGRFACDARHRRIHGCGLFPPPDWKAAMASCVHPEDMAAMEAAVSDALDSGRVLKAEYRVLEPAAGELRTFRVRWVAAEGSVVRDAAGKPVRIHGVSRDVTASKEAESALKESEARLRDALVAGQVMAFEWDPLTGASQRSENTAAIIGPESSAGSQPRDFLSHVHPDDRGRFISEVYGVSPEAPSYALSFRFIRADGREVCLEETAKAEFDSSGRFVLLRGLTRDVTARNAAQQALEESERQFRLLVQGVRDYAIVMLDPDGSVINWNPGAEHILGYRADEIIGETFSRFHLPTEAGFAANELDVAARDGRYETEGWRVRKDGTRFWASVIIDAIRGEEGKLVGFAKVTRDISERRRAEEHQALLVAELDHRVKNALARVAIVAERTRETSQSMPQFVSSLQGRIQSMANAHALLSRSRWQGVGLADLVSSELAPYTTACNTSVDGPDIRLTANATQAVAMVLHELVTNAAKYGALSCSKGRVAVTWSQSEELGQVGDLVIDWEEADGGAIVPSPPAGYGTSVIRNLIPHQLGGSVEFAFLTNGVHCRMEIPSASVVVVRSDKPCEGVRPPFARSVLSVGATSQPEA